jgi:hypothetical protein
MDSSIMAAYRKKNPDRWQGADAMIWHEDLGLLIPSESLPDGTTVWVEVKGQAERVEARYQNPSGTIMSPEIFARIKRESLRKGSTCDAYSHIKKAMKELFGGWKPEGMSWSTARRLIADMERRKAFSEDPVPSWPRLMGLRMGAFRN